MVDVGESLAGLIAPRVESRRRCQRRRRRRRQTARDGMDRKRVTLDAVASRRRRDGSAVVGIVVVGRGVIGPRAGTLL